MGKCWVSLVFIFRVNSVRLGDTRAKVQQAKSMQNSTTVASVGSVPIEQQVIDNLVSSETVDIWALIR